MQIQLELEEFEVENEVDESGADENEASME